MPFVQLYRDAKPPVPPPLSNHPVLPIQLQSWSERDPRYVQSHPLHFINNLQGREEA